MSKYTPFVFIFFLYRNLALAQCAAVDFEVPLNACIQSTLAFLPTDENQSSYEWDFCAGELDAVPTASVLTTTTPSAYKVAFIQSNSNTYGFYTSRANGHLYRLDFGLNPNSSPTPVDLGNLGIPGGAKLSVAIVNAGPNYFGFLIDYNNLVYRFAFGNALTNQPSNAQLVYQNGLLANPIDLVTADDESGKFVFVVNLGSNKVTRLKFTDYDADIASISVDDFTVTNSGALAGISMIKDCERWYALTTARGTGQISKIFFDETLADDDPIVNQILGLNFMVTQPAGISIAFDNNHYYGFLVSNEGQSKLFRIDFGDTMGNAPIANAELGDLNLLSGVWGFSMFKYNSQWIILASENTGPRIFRIEFPSNCFSSQSYSRSKAINIVAESAGQFNVTLTTSTAQGVRSTSAHTIIVENKTIPPFTVGSHGICVTAPVEFLVSTQNQAFIQNVAWDFGDQSGVNTDLAPNHSYSLPGQYDINLRITAVNGCKSFAKKTLHIYPKPIADFDIPSSILCTNTEITFSNLTTDVFDGNLQYAWAIDNIGVSATRDLVVSLESTGIKTISMTASIEGCSSQIEKSTSEVFAGPAIDFDVLGHCEKENIQFREAIAEEVLSMEWNFGDGSGSTDGEVSHFFAVNGTYLVSLSASSPNGCNNFKTKQVTIDAKPTPDFSIENPPSSCSGYLSRFADLTPEVGDGQLELWHWDFSDGGSANEENPRHVFQNAGEYDVALTVTTDHGCVETVIKPVTILQSPTAEIAYSQACLNKPVNFSASSTNAVNYYWEIGTSYYETQNVVHGFVLPGIHEVKLNVADANGCVTTIIREVSIPDPVSPVFSSTNNCKGLETKFTTTFASLDPVVAQNWNFSGEGSSIEANPTFRFTTVGPKTVTLQVTTASGCVYQRESLIDVIEPPKSDFTFVPDFGVPPQEISFTNASLNASFFNWKFGDGDLSSELSPKHTFKALGDYNVELIASNTAGCQNSILKTISMVAPLPDVDLSLMTITPNTDGTSKVIITIANNGNTFLKNLPVRLDISGNVTLETIVQESIAPFSKYNLVLNFGIAQNQMLEFLCASARLEGDLHPEGNRICNQLKSEIAVLSPYPNPTQNILNVEWVAQEGESVKVHMVGADGKNAIEFTETSTTGLNQKILDISTLRSGIYILQIIGPSHSKTYRILVAN